MKPKAVLAYCREKGIRSFDLRFADLDGHWRHITMPLSSLSEASFEEGFGQEVVLDPKAQMTPYGILVPNSEANYLDPFTQQPTLILLATIQDLLQRQESALDSRYVSAKALRYLHATAIADDIVVRSTLRFGAPKEHLLEQSTRESVYMSCSRNDRDYLFRCELTDKAADSGVQIDRHYIGPNGASEMVLKSSSLVEAGDDIMMFRYLLHQLESNYQHRITMDGFWSTSQWSFIRNGEWMFSGSASKGLSETGLYAQGGLIRHAQALTAIYLLPWLSPSNLRFPFCRSVDGNDPHAFCRPTVDAQSPRVRCLEIRGVPSLANHYLAYAAIVMAMIDGIQNKWLPPTSADAAMSSHDKLQITPSGMSEFVNVDELASGFDDDWDFLARGDVFHEDLLQSIRNRLRSAS